jgi:hypothetical protein
MPKNIEKFDLYCYTHVVEDIAKVYGLDDSAKIALILEMAGAIRSGKLQVKDPVTGWPFHVTPTMDNPSPYVKMLDVNIWLSMKGYPYQWTPNGLQVINLPSSAPVQGNTTAIRRDLLTTPIEAAIKVAGNYEIADVHLQLKELALGGVLPFTGVIDGGNFFYTDAGNEIAVLKKTALAQRLKRLKKRAENSAQVA